MVEICDRQYGYDSDDDPRHNVNVDDSVCSFFQEMDKNSRERDVRRGKNKDHKSHKPHKEKHKKKKKKRYQSDSESSGSEASDIECLS